jgi:hypothetical protein
MMIQVICFPLKRLDISVATQFCVGPSLVSRCKQFLKHSGYLDWHLTHSGKAALESPLASSVDDPTGIERALH